MNGELLQIQSGVLDLRSSMLMDFRFDWFLMNGIAQVNWIKTFVVKRKVICVVISLNASMLEKSVMGNWSEFWLIMGFSKHELCKEFTFERNGEYRVVRMWCILATSDLTNRRVFQTWVSTNNSHLIWDLLGRMVVGFTTTYAMRAYHH